MRRLLDDLFPPFLPLGQLIGRALLGIATSVIVAGLFNTVGWLGALLIEQAMGMTPIVNMGSWLFSLAVLTMLAALLGTMMVED